MIAHFEKEYFNGDGKPWRCGVTLILNTELSKADIAPSKSFQKDLSQNRLPLWQAIKELIGEALQYAEQYKKMVRD